MSNVLINNLLSCFICVNVLISNMDYSNIFCKGKDDRASRLSFFVLLPVNLLRCNIFVLERTIYVSVNAANYIPLHCHNAKGVDAALSLSNLVCDNQRIDET